MAERNATLTSTVETLLEGKKYSTIKDVLITMEPADVAGILAEIGDARIPKLFRLLPKEQAAETFAELDPEQQELLIRGFSDAELHDIIEELYVDDAVDLVEEMPANVVKRILAQANPDTRKEINDLLRYPENSAGSIMTTEYVSLRPGMTVRDAIGRIRSTGVDKETIYTCYVTESRKLLGQVSVKDMILCEDENTPVSQIMDEHVISVSTLTDQEEVAQMLSRYNFLALPVIDTDGHMVGIVTFDDAMDVMVEETTEDIEKMAAILPSDKTYLRSNAWDLFKHRIPWLALLMVSATFTGMIITGFEDALAAVVVLTAFIPMLMDTGAHRLHPHADGHRRQLRLPGLGLHHPRPVPGRAGVCGPAQGGVEGDPDRRALRLRPGPAVLCQDHAGGQAHHGGGRQSDHRGGGLLHHGRHGAHRQGGGLHPAHGGPEAGPGPGGHGQPLHHHHRGRPVPAGVLRHRQGPAVLSFEF